MEHNYRLKQGIFFMTVALGQIEWALRQMPLLRKLQQKWQEELPLTGARMCMVFHVSNEVAALAYLFKSAGASVRLIPSKIATVEKNLIPVLRELGIDVRDPQTGGEKLKELREVLDYSPDLIVDNADLFKLWHSQLKPPSVIGLSAHSRSACQIIETHVETGNQILFPVSKIGSTRLKLELESLYGTGQSVLDAIIRITGRQLNTMRITVVGFGNVGSGIARYARGGGARVTIVQNSAYRALKAVFEGFEVSPLDEAVSEADLVITATGGRGIIGRKQLEKMRDGAFLGNVGRDAEFDLSTLRTLATSTRRVNEHIEEFVVNSRSLFLLGGGHQFNHMVGAANSAEIMDLSLALHAHVMADFWKDRKSPAAKVATPVSERIVDRVVADKFSELRISYK